MPPSVREPTAASRQRTTRGVAGPPSGRCPSAVRQSATEGTRRRVDIRSPHSGEAPVGSGPCPAAARSDAPSTCGSEPARARRTAAGSSRTGSSARPRRPRRRPPASSRPSPSRPGLTTPPLGPLLDRQHRRGVSPSCPTPAC